MIEFAVMLPLLVVLVLATIEATSMVFLRQSLEIACYEGCRVSLVPGTDPSHVTDTVNQILTTRHVTGATVTVDPADFDVYPYGTYIHVSVSAPCDANSLIAPWFYHNRSLTANVEMMKEN